MTKYDLIVEMLSQVSFPCRPIDLATCLGVSSRTIRRYLTKHSLKCMSIGGRRRIPRGSAELLLQRLVK